MTELLTILLFALGVLLFPFMVYLCVKAGTYGYLMAISRFEKLNRKEVDNGEA